MRFDWTKPFVTVSTVAMEACWLYILLFVLTVRPQPDLVDPVLPFLAVFGLLAGSLAYSALVDFLGLRGRLLRVLQVALILFVSLWMSKGGITQHYGLFDGGSWGAFFQILTDLNHQQFLRALVGIVSSLLLCLRGAALYEIELETPARSFRLGMVVAAFSILVGSLFVLDIEAVGAQMLRAIVGFFLFGLLGVAVSQLRRERAGAEERPGARWFLILLPAIGIILIGGILLATVFSPNLGDMLSTVWTGVAGAAIWLITPMVVAAYAMAELIRLLFTPQQQPPTPEAGPTGSPSPIIQTVTPMEDLIREPALLRSPWRFVVTGVIVALIVAGVVYLIWNFLSRTRRGSEVWEERESLWSWDELSRDVQGWLGQLRQRLSRERAMGLRGLLEHLRGPPTTVAIRRAYIRLLLLALERGLERAEGQTPREYLGDLHRNMPEYMDEMTTLTHAYVYARYDPRPAAPELARQAETAWEQIERRERLRGSRAGP